MSILGGIAAGFTQRNCLAWAPLHRQPISVSGRNWSVKHSQGDCTDSSLFLTIIQSGFMCPHKTFCRLKPPTCDSTQSVSCVLYWHWFLSSIFTGHATTPTRSVQRLPHLSTVSPWGPSRPWRAPNGPGSVTRSGTLTLLCVTRLLLPGSEETDRGGQ